MKDIKAWDLGLLSCALLMNHSRHIPWSSGQSQTVNNGTKVLHQGGTVQSWPTIILQTGLHGRGGGHARGQIYNKEAFVQEVAANVIRTVSNLIADDKVLAWMDLKVPLRMKMMNH